ncbi:MAG: hypothetical protein KDD78_07085 [Caldilineaceae bacterium]|nr:hypothetical protein [Caldilineaceae bacterium]
MTRWRVALLYNLKHAGTVSPDAPADALADYDTPETVQAVENALAGAGYEVFPLEADHTLLDTIRDVNPDICFNMAKGMNGNERAAQVPALLEMLNLPYTGATVMGHALAMDKSAAKQIWQERGLATAPYQLMFHGDDVLTSTLAAELAAAPLFVKPVHEGSGMGVGPDSLVHNEAELRRRVAWLVDTYQQPALVEAYLPGREFSVGILGNRAKPQPRPHYADPPAAALLPILELISARTPHNPTTAATDGAIMLCPATVDSDLQRALSALALAAYESIGALDAARVDLRLDKEGRPMLLEIDVLPSLDPHSSRFVTMAHCHGLSYTALIDRILNLALARHGFKRKHSLPSIQSDQQTSYSSLRPLSL